MAGLQWDTGVSVRVGGGAVEGSAALTTGTLSNPRLHDDNDGRQLSARIRVTPRVGLDIGFSAARGEYLDRRALNALSPDLRGRRYRQRAIGVDAEYSMGYWLVRTEIFRGEWDTPALAVPAPARPLGVVAVDVEGRYKILPGLYAAVRVDHLAFSDVQGTAGSLSWDADVIRIEVGGGYSLGRNLLVKASYQHNWRDGGRVRRERIVALQCLYWF
jgi:predicted porin